MVTSVSNAPENDRQDRDGHAELLRDVGERIVALRRSYLDRDGRQVAKLPDRFQDNEALRRFHASMTLARAFDQKAIALQRTGRLGTYPSLLGQEAVGVGIASGMRADDVLLPSHRDGAAMIARGVEIEELLRYWGGGRYPSSEPPEARDFPMCLTVGLHTTHAVGAGYALKLQGEGRVAVCVFGEGAVAKGDFWEAINFAAVAGVPVVFVCVNNRWATSIPLALQTASATIAQKAIAAGFAGEQVDGNDVIAVAAAMEDAAERARHGGGPQLVEALTYRLSDHSTADDASKYRTKEEVDDQRLAEPIRRLRTFLTGRGAWDRSREEALVRDCAVRVNQAVDCFLRKAPASPEVYIRKLYHQLPSQYEDQARQLRTDGCA